MIAELKTLVAVARYGTFAAAGDRIGLTQSAVSGHMRRLEEHLGFALFARTGRSAELNAAGKRVLGKAQDILASVDDLSNPNADTDAKGTLRIGAITSAQPTIVKRALVAFHHGHKGYSLQVVPGTSMELLDRLDAGELDLAVIIRPDFGLSGHLRWTGLVREEFVLAAPSDIAGDDWVKLINTHPFLRYNRVSFGGRLVQQILDQSGAQVRDWVEIDDISTLLHMVAEGLGVAIVPRTEAYRGAFQNVRCLPLPNVKAVREIGVVSHLSNFDSAVADFLLDCEQQAQV